MQSFTLENQTAGLKWQHLMAQQRSNSTNLFTVLWILCSALTASSAVAQYSLPGNGVINTVGGNGTPGYTDDGVLATNSELNVPTGVASDASGNIYIADSANNLIREIGASNGYISTVVGTGTAGYAGDGTIYPSSNPASVELNHPQGVAVVSFVNSTNTYIADTGNNRIRELTTTHYPPPPNNEYPPILESIVLATVAGGGTGCTQQTDALGDGCPAASAVLNSPTGVAADASGNVYIADSGNNIIRVVSASTGIISILAGTGTAGYSGDGGPAANATLNNPHGVAVDQSGNLYIADMNNHRIRMIAASTANEYTAGYIYTVAGSGSGTSSGDGGPAASATLDFPASVTVDNYGNLYIANIGNASDGGHIRIVAASATNGYTAGNIYTIAGNGTNGFSGDDGPAIEAELNSPSGVAVDQNGNVYFADTTNNRVRAVGTYRGIPSISASCTPNPLPAGSTAICTVSAGNGATGIVTGTEEYGSLSPGPGGLPHGPYNWGWSALVDGSGTFNPCAMGCYPEEYINFSLTYNGDVNNQVVLARTGIVVYYPQTITFTPPPSPVTYPVAPITLQASGGGICGTPVIFSVYSGPGSLNGNILTVTGVGTIIVTANEAGGIFCIAAPQVTQIIQVNAPVPSFNLGVGASTMSIAQSSITTQAVVVSEINYSGAVTLTALGLPSGVTPVFSTNPAISSGELILEATDTVKPGTYTITITGTSGTLSASSTFVLTVTATSTSLLANGYYEITNINSGQALEDPGYVTKHGEAMDQWSVNGGSNQYWRLTNLGKNVVSLVNDASDQALEVTGSSTANKALVDQNPYTDKSSQKWNVLSLGNGNFVLTNVHSGQSLEVAGGSLVVGAKIYQFPYQGNRSQQWSIHQ